MEAGDPEDSAAEEKEVEEKEGERKGERIGSLAKESRMEDGGGGGRGEAAVEEAGGGLKVERRWRGEEDVVVGDLWSAAGETIFFFLGGRGGSIK